MARKKKREKKVYHNNVWDKEDFEWCYLREKIKLVGFIKQFIKCVKWSKQRITRGYAQCDWWGMHYYLQRLIPDMLQDLKDNRMGSPCYLGENYTNEDGVVINDTCHEEWDKILGQMIFLWREVDEETCSRKNPYDEEYHRASEEFDEKYGLHGEKLRSKEEHERYKKEGCWILHTMKELPEYRDIYEKYFAEEREIDRYREECMEKAMDMMKEYFFALWD